MSDFVHSSGQVLVSQIFWHMIMNASIIASPPCLISSAGTLSTPGDFFVFSIRCGLPRFPPPLTVPCSISLASVLCLVASPNHWSFRRFTVAKSGFCGPAASLMACITDIFVMWSL